MRLINGVKKFIMGKVNNVKEIIFNDRKRAITGMIFVGLGTAMIVSAYVKLPQ